MPIMNSIQSGARDVVKFVAKESPTILTGLSVAGVITTVALTVRGTIKAVQIVEHEKQQMAIDMSVEGETQKEVYPEDIDLTPMEIAKLTWKCYIPTIGMSVVTMACIIGAHSIHSKRHAALAGLYSLSETAFKEYKEAVVEKLGQKGEDKVMDGLAEREIKDHPLRDAQVIMTGQGETLFLESLSGRYFKSDMQKVRKAINDFNFLLINHSPFMTVNEWYDCLNLAHVANGNYMGWRTDAMLEVHFSSQLVEDQETACVVINYKVMPHKE